MIEIIMQFTVGGQDSNLVYTKHLRLNEKHCHNLEHFQPFSLTIYVIVLLEYFNIHNEYVQFYNRFSPVKASFIYIFPECTEISFFWA